jgi:hypothetical protein
LQVNSREIQRDHARHFTEPEGTRQAPRFQVQFRSPLISCESEVAARGVVQETDGRPDLISPQRFTVSLLVNLQGLPEFPGGEENVPLLAQTRQVIGFRRKSDRGGRRRRLPVKGEPAPNDNQGQSA